MYKYLIAFILFSFTLLFSQSVESGHQPEIYATSIGYDVSNLFIEKISVTYCNAVESDDYYGGSAVTPLSSPGKAGWGLCNVGQSDFNLYGWGVYKIYAKGTSHYFYLDIRDLNYPNGQPDFKIEFNYNSYSAEKYFRLFPYANSNEYEDCIDSTVKQIWKVRGALEPDVSGFPSDYWNKCLAVGKTGFDPPHPIWSKYPGFTSIDSYQLYRGMVDLNNNTVPNDDDFILVTTENDTVFDYEDNDDDYVLDINKIGGWSYIALYYVKAKSGNSLSPRTNIVPVFSLISWSNALVMANEKNNPLLMWDKYKGFDAANISGYKIYRGMPSPIKPSLFIFNSIATVTKDEFEFIDHDIFLSSSSGEIRYYVKAVLSQGESSATNTVSANGGLYKNSPPAA